MLVALWLTLALGLAAWSALSSPRAMDGASGAPAEVVVLEAAPPGGMLSIWAHLDEGRGAWAVLEAGERWPRTPPAGASPRRASRLIPARPI